MLLDPVENFLACFIQSRRLGSPQEDRLLENPSCINVLNILFMVEHFK